MKPLQRSDRKSFGRHLLRLAHHLLLVCAVAVQCDQQGSRRRRSGSHIVVKVDARVEDAVEFWFHNYADYTDFARMAPQTFSRGASDEIPGRIQYRTDDEASAGNAAEDAEGNG